jgi:hypothetical protein
MNNMDKEHDFQFLRWYRKHLEDPDGLLLKLNFNDYKSFLYRLVDQFAIWYREFGCWACCRTLLPEFVNISEKNAKEKFNDIIKEKREKYDEVQKNNMKHNYEHYFTDFWSEGKSIRIEMEKEFDYITK